MMQPESKRELMCRRLLVHPIDCINNGHSSCDVLKPRVSILTVAILFFFLETEVTLFGKEGGAEAESHNARQS